MKKERFLWVVPMWPFPPDSGATVARANLIQNLVKAGYIIDILNLGVETKNLYIPKDLAIANVYPIKIHRINNIFVKKLFLLLLSIFRIKTPLVMWPFRKIHKQAEQIFKQNKWDVIVYDGLHAAIFRLEHGLYFRDPWAKKIIYREHNVESEIWWRMAAQQKNKLAKYCISYQAKRLELFEHSVIKEVDGIAAVSQDDLNKLIKLEPSTQGRVVPISFAFTKMLPFPKNNNKLQLMFLGNLDWLPNKEGLIWFLSKVWKKLLLQRKDMVLNIAGSGSSAWINPYIQQPNIQFLGKIPNIKDLYKESCLVIAPIFFGSGTRVKIIEACNFGRPCISTTLGAEGIDLENKVSFFCADTAKEWVGILAAIQLDALNEMGKHAFNSAKKSFAHEVAVAEFKKCFEKNTEENHCE